MNIVADILIGVGGGIAAFVVEKVYARLRLRHLAKKELEAWEKTKGEWEKTKGEEKKDPPDVIHGC